MEAQNKPQVFISWRWLILTLSVASMPMTVNGRCKIDFVNSTVKSVNYSGRGFRTLPTPLPINDTLTFNLSGNVLRRFPGGMVRFTLPCRETLDLSHNQIQELDPMAFGYVPSLGYLYINHNQLSSIISGSFMNLNNLQVLDISLNNLLDLPKGLWEGLIELKKLLLSSNALVVLNAGAFDFLKQLEYLDLSHNQISVIDANAFTELTLLQHLKLYRNDLTEVPHIPDGFRQDLETLNLSGNPITTLGPDAFGRLVYLHYLDLSKMDLEYVDPTTFKDLQALNELYLDTNRLQTLQVESINSLQSLHSLSLFKNLWVCDCSLSVLVEYLFSKTSSNVSVTQLDSTFCRGADSMRVPLRLIDSSELCTFPYEVVIPAVIGSVVLITVLATLMCICRKKRVKMPDEAPTSAGGIPQHSPGISQQTSPVSVQSSVTMTSFENNIPDTSGDNSALTGNKTLDHFYSSIKIESPVYCYAATRDLLPQGPDANTIKSPPTRCLTYPSKPEEDDGLYLKPMKKPPTR